ncbi:MAG TPA: hypothetical protein VN643_18335 [Pyrinomonadaceae bacterium]|nr:hypothetical protein [Pyrinomonadaceae bacterium]
MADTFKFPTTVTADRTEKVFMRFAEGQGEVRPDGRGLSIALNVTDTGGKPDGSQVCSGEVKGAKSLNDLLKVPSSPKVKFGDPGPIKEVPVTAICQASWKFKDGSTLTAIGKGTSTLVELASGKAVLADKAALTITGGTGVYKGARGSVAINSTVTADSMADIPFGQPGAEINQKSIELFRVFKGKDLK